MNKLLNAVIASGAGASLQLECPHDDHGFEVEFAGGTCTSLAVVLQGSVSGSFWSTLATISFSGATMTAKGGCVTTKDKMVEWVRANVTNYSSGFCSMCTLTAGGIPISGSIIVIDTKQYKYATTATSTEGFVKRGASAATAIQNLSLAVIHGAGAGTKYSCAASHPSATIGTLTANTLIIRARTLGAAGNSIVLSSTSSSLVAGHSTLQLGCDKAQVTAHYTPYPNI